MWGYPRDPGPRLRKAGGRRTTARRPGCRLALVLFALPEALSSSATGYIIRADDDQSPERVTSARGRHA